MRLSQLTLIALLMTPLPALAQDFLQSFGRFVEETLPQRSRAAAQPSAPVAPTPASERPAGDGDARTGTDEIPPLPRPRPDVQAAPAPEAEVAPEAAAVDEKAEAATGPAATEPGRIYQTACPALLSGVVVGTMMKPIEEGLCGEQSPLSVTALRINGHDVHLSSPVTTNCEMAGALVDWVGSVDAYARAALDSPVATLQAGTSMMCRNRYGAADGFVSEHGFANALDVTGFTLENGQTIAVAADWPEGGTLAGKLLRQAHGAACGRFTTVLGPEANAEHEDHFHLDLGCHGQTCTAQICE